MFRLILLFIIILPQIVYAQHSASLSDFDSKFGKPEVVHTQHSASLSDFDSKFGKTQVYQHKTENLKFEFLSISGAITTNNISFPDDPNYYSFLETLRRSGGIEFKKLPSKFDSNRLSMFDSETSVPIGIRLEGAAINLEANDFLLDSIGAKGFSGELSLGITESNDTNEMGIVAAIDLFEVEGGLQVEKNNGFYHFKVGGGAGLGGGFKKKSSVLEVKGRMYSCQLTELSGKLAFGLKMSVDDCSIIYNKKLSQYEEALKDKDIQKKVAKQYQYHSQYEEALKDKDIQKKVAEKYDKNQRPNNEIIKRGDQGNHVKEIQKQLGVKEDGIFGAKTEKALMEFQKSRGLKEDGIVGAETKKALDILQKTKQSNNDNKTNSSSTQNISNRNGTGTDYATDAIRAALDILQKTNSRNDTKIDSGKISGTQKMTDPVRADLKNKENRSNHNVGPK